MFQNTQSITQVSNILAQEAFSGLFPLIQSCFSQLQNNLIQREEIMKPEGVCELFKISMPTLNALVKSGKFHKYHFKGAKGVYYKRSEILQALTIME